MKDLDTELDELFECSCKHRETNDELEDAEWRPPPKPVNVDCPAPGRPFEILDQFGFNSAALNPVLHPPRIARVASAIVASQRTSAPIRTVLLSGHTDPAGNDNYNFQLGRRRAEDVLRALRAQLDRSSPGLSGRITFQLTTCGERQPKAYAPQSRRVEIFFPKPIPKRNEGRSCGIPARPGLLREIEQEGSRPRAAAQPRLCLFMNAGETSHRNHFQCGASRQAARIGAVASPTAANCQRRIGATSYDTGADIIRSIESARACLGRPVDAVHVFSHGFGEGIPGTTMGSAGLYRNGYPGVDRTDGGRTLSDLPTAALANNVTFVLHGCNLGSGEENFARSLYQRLRAGSLTNPKVLAHRNGGCAGRDDSWREYSNAHPNGRNVAPLRNLASTGCCAS